MKELLFVILVFVIWFLLQAVILSTIRGKNLNGAGPPVGGQNNQHHRSATS